MISFRSWFNLTGPPPYTPIGEPPSDEKYLQETSKYWFGNIEGFTKFTSLRKPSNMSSTSSTKDIIMVDTRPNSPSTDVEAEPLIPQPTVHQPPSDSDDGDKDEPGFAVYVDAVGFAHVVCFILALGSLFTFSVTGGRLGDHIGDWPGQYAVYWIAMVWNFAGSVRKLFKISLRNTHIRVAINSMECSIGGVGGESPSGMLLRKFCSSIIHLTVGMLVIGFTAHAGKEMGRCYGSYWSCRDSNFSPVVIGFASALGAIQTILAFMEPFPRLVSKYVCIRFSIGTVNRKDLENANIYLA